MRFFVLWCSLSVQAQTVYELNTGWPCTPLANVKQTGAVIYRPGFWTADWMPDVAIDYQLFLVEYLTNKSLEILNFGIRH